LVVAAARGGASRRTAYGEISGGAARRGLDGPYHLMRIVGAEKARGAGTSPAPTSGAEEEAMGRALLAAFPDRLVRRRAAGRARGRMVGGGGVEVAARRRAAGAARGVMVGGRGVQLDAESGVRRPELFLALDLDAGRRGERAEA